MKRKSKWFAMTAMLFGGATLFQGCLNLGGFWDGFLNGWPSGDLKPRMRRCAGE